MIRAGLRLAWVAHRRARARLCCLLVCGIAGSGGSAWAREHVTVEAAMVKRDPATGVMHVQLPPYRAGDEPVGGGGFQKLQGAEVMLNAWVREGSAAGLLGDLYDNRDRGHSLMHLAQFPQLGTLAYGQGAGDGGYGVQSQMVFTNRVVLGNSSTAMTSGLWRSNARLCYTNPRFAAALYAQYTANNLYVYPEHKDHDPGRNGEGTDNGYGDVYPANTPYVINSQGSSGSDRVFLGAVAATIAAYSPQTKAKLVEHGLLMPTVQMILRRTQGGHRDDAAYLRGDAHPSAFEGSQLDMPAMVRLAHAIRPDALPPLARVKVVEEYEPQLGRDYADVGPRVKLMDTPAAIARIHRHPGVEYRLVLDAADSFDANKRALRYHWVVLRGDASRITIAPDGDGARATITVRWHERRPIAPGSALESNRVDIGLFVHNGAHYSAPAFLSISTLDDEARTYDERGRIVEIDHGAGTYSLRVEDWEAVVDAASDPAHPVFTGRLSDRERQELRTGLGAVIAEREWRLAEAAVDAAQKAWKQAVKQGPDAERAALKARADAIARRDELKPALTRARSQPGGAEARAIIDHAIRGVLDDPGFALANIDTLNGPSVAPAVVRQRDRLVALGVLRPRGEHGYELLSVREGDAPVDTRLTPFERRQIASLNASIVESALPHGAISLKFTLNYIDPAIAARRPWRDVHHYDPATGNRVGWTRYLADGGIERFTADGARVTETDSRDRPIAARVVRYGIKPGSNAAAPTLVAQDTPVLLRYTYADENDRLGRVLGAVPASP